MAKKTFIVTVTESHTNQVNAAWLKIKLMQGFGMYPPEEVTIESIEPRHPLSYRDPDLSDKWLKEALWRVDNDRSMRFKWKDAGLIIKRLVAEVRKLNRMLNR